MRSLFFHFEISSCYCQISAPMLKSEVESQSLLRRASLLVCISLYLLHRSDLIVVRCPCAPLAECSFFLSITTCNGIIIHDFMLIFHGCPLAVVHFMKKETVCLVLHRISLASLRAWHLVGSHDTIVRAPI